MAQYRRVNSQYRREAQYDVFDVFIVVVVFDEEADERAAHYSLKLVAGDKRAAHYSLKLVAGDKKVFDVFIVVIVVDVFDAGREVLKASKPSPEG